MRRILIPSLSAGVLMLSACSSPQNSESPSSAEAATAETNAPVEASGGGVAAESRDGIRDVRVRVSGTNVEITFTALPNAFASVTIGPTPPQTVQLPAALARETGVNSVLVLDPEQQVAGYLLRSSTASYALNTARDRPEEGSTNGPGTLNPATTYHFIISVPGRAAQPGEDEDDLPMGAQHAGTFTTGR